jgi:glycosyltransferase involved in cell wall biosynthesis
LLFPGEEDFGIVPVEAQACGASVIALGRGGATETIIPPGGHREPTGMWFEEQTAESLVEALERYEKRATDFTPGAARRQALRFHAPRFAAEMFAYVAAVVRPDTSPVRQAA